MTDKELVEAIRLKTGYKKSMIADVMNTYVKIARDELESGNDVKIRKLGVLRYIPALPRNGYNPIKARQEVFKGKNRVKFIASALLMKAMNSGRKEENK